MKNKKTLIIGLGKSGVSAAEFLLSQGTSIIGVDKNIDLINENSTIQKLRSQGATIQHDSVALDMQDIQRVIISPGVPNTHPLYLQAVNKNIEVIGEVELACRFLSQKVIGITGTNGKTTVTSLVTHVLQSCGIPARALGNIGTPLTSEMLNNNNDEIFVIELSSYQLETMQTPNIDVGVILNITPDHLDRYANMDAYASAKIKIKDCIKANGKLYIEDRAYQDFYHLWPGDKPYTYGYRPECHISTDCYTVTHKGKKAFTLPEIYRGVVTHDAENLVAAYALCQDFQVTAQQFLEAYSTFTKPPHRLEYCRTVSGVKYYDDSKGTNIDAVMRAVTTLKGPVILIAGGVDKGASYLPWIDAFKGKVICIYAIGEAAEKIQKELSPKLPVQICDSLEKAVHNATKQAKPGDYVLLSPGCSSFDMFKDYAHRGNEFKRFVNEI